MRRGTTPTITMELPGEIPVTNITDAVLSILINDKEIIIKSLTDMTESGTGNALEIILTQEETLSLKGSGTASVQLKLKLSDTVIASDIMRIPVNDILNEEVI